MALELEPSQQQWGTDNVFEDTTISPSYYSRRSHLGSSNLEVFIEEEHTDGAITSSGADVLTVSTATASSAESATSPQHVSGAINGSVAMRRGDSKSQSASNLGLNNGEPARKLSCVGVC